MKLLARVLFTLGSRLPCGLAPPRRCYHLIVFKEKWHSLLGEVLALVKE
ncbi:DECR1 isoform 3 [Pongo abelii]|uniref:DECR1 isoform 3 n=1 Tax=Pongo abelii TaxID=9601 RepID=A0A2J8UG03_PONAB|nr:DECR1 isoform 3 [Pongo abelii]